jgi:HSP20 family protein
MTALERSNGNGHHTPFTNLVQAMFREIDPFEAFAGFPDVAGARGLGSMTPAVDIQEQADEYVVKCDLPGVDPKDISLTVEDDVVVLKAQRQREEQRQGDGYRYSERSFGSYERSFRLGKVVDGARAKAVYERGVLTLHLPKREEAKPRAIPIETKEP